MKFLLDTDTCVYWLHGHTAIRDHLITVGPEAASISVITLAELCYGADCSARPEANHQAVDNFAGVITILGIDPESARMFGDIKAQLRQRGMLIEDFDLMIAATALVYDLILVTNNTGHFQRIPSLCLENWV